jgi:uncharacterized Zn-binding protein involved in type VI secretion
VVERKAAAQAGDTTGCAGSTIVQDSPNVFIHGKPVQGDQTGCGGSIVSGATGVVYQWQAHGSVGDAAGLRGHETARICH